MPSEPVAIRGAGPAGCALALLLRAQGTPLALLGERPKARAAFRPIALSHASRLILERVGAWTALAASPIRSVHVSQQGAFGRTRMSAADAGVPALGYVADYADLHAALLDRVDAAGIALRDGQDAAAHAPLVVHAEGTEQAIEARNYGQDAVVALVSAIPAAGDTAWERFTPGGPLALLPFGARYSLVWGMPPERAKERCALPPADFLADLQRAFGARAGELTAVEARSRVPLALRVRRSRVGERAAYIGNAAQTLHPVAGQGLNLALRDAWDLAQALQGAADPGAAQVLGRFNSARRLDAAATVRVTDFLATGFLGGNPAGAMIRGIGLTALDICLPARRFFARRMIFGASALP
jgi:2-octaprenyl-6-methoxyphenol hydroxylase